MIRNDCLYYVGIPNSENNSANARLFSLDQSGNREVIEEVLVEYPYLHRRYGNDDLVNVLMISFVIGTYKDQSNLILYACSEIRQMLCLHWESCCRRISYIILRQMRRNFLPGTVP